MTTLMLLIGFVAGFQTAQEPSSGPSKGRARTVEIESGQTVTVTVAISDAVRNLPTAVTLPESVQEVISSWNEKDISVEQSGPRLFLKLFATVEGHLDLVLAGGQHLRLYVKSARAGEPYDEALTLKLASTGELPGTAEKKAPPALELAKAMRLGLVPSGVSVKKGSEAILLKDGGVETRLALIYEAASLRGYVLSLSNTSPTNALQLNVSRFSSPGMVLIGAKSLLVPPGKSTLVYLIFRK